MAFYHMAVADRALLDALTERCLTAIGCEIIQQENGRLPVLSAVSEIAGQMTRHDRGAPAAVELAADGESCWAVLRECRRRAWSCWAPARWDLRRAGPRRPRARG